MSSRGGRGRGRGGGRPKSREEEVSRKMSWLLRHGAEKEGLKLQEGGFLTVTEVLNNRNLRSIRATWPELLECVLSSDKQRFTLKPLPDLDPAPAMPPLPTSNPADYLVRANQGHSIQVDSAELLTPVEEAKGNVPEVCVHGTNEKAWRAIWATGGLRKMGRNHVHFARGLPKGFKEMGDGDAGAAGGAMPAPQEVQEVQPEAVVVEGEAGASEAKDVVSGMRNSSTVLIYIDVVKALGMGIKFWISDNGVILSEGNQDGVVPLEVFKKVEDRKAKAIIVRDGILLEDADVGKGKKKG